VQILEHTFSVDGLSLFFKLLFITLSALAIGASGQLREIAPARRSEYTALVLAATLAMCVASAASDLFLAFLAIQATNILTYFIAGYGKRSEGSIESAVKFMVMSAVAAGLFLYGLAMLFAVTHTLNIQGMHLALVAKPLAIESLGVILILLLLPLAFQVAAFPAHFWAPDVLEGAPTPASAFLSVGPRVAGLAVMIRVMVAVFAQQGASQGQWQVLGSVDWTSMLAFLSGATMLIGTLVAFRQKATKRMIGYLVMADSGFLLLGLLVLDQVGLAALLFSLIVELFALFGIYYVLAFIHDEIDSDQISALRGMLGRAVPECICLVIFLLCFVGLPPFPGFVGSFALIGAAVRHGWTALAVVAVISRAISFAAVGRLIYGLIGDLRVSIHQPVGHSRSRTLFLAALVAPLAVIGVLANVVLEWAGRSLGFILW